MTQTLITLTFNGSGSTDPDGTITLASWSFGDGATAPGLTVTHSYATAGTYTATLTVIDNGGKSGTDTAVVTVQNRPPVANAGPDASTAPGVAVTLNGSGSSDPDGTIVSYAWTFGDGASGSGATPTHTYAAAGIYVATLTVTDNNGAHSADSTNVNVGTVSRWASAIGSTGSDAGFAVAGDAAGDTFVGGTFQGRISIGGTSLTSLGGSDWFIAKYSSAGVLQWAQREGGTSDDLLDGLAVTAGGDVVASGHFVGTASFGGTALVSNGPSDMVVAKYAGANGAHRWSARYGGIYDDAASAVAVDGSDNVYLTGYFSGSVDFGGGVLNTPFGSDLDVFVAKFDGAGNPLWSKNFTNSGNDRGYGIAANGQHVAIVGSFSNGIDFGGGTLGSANGLIDAFVAVLDPSTGAYQWARQIGSPNGNEAAYGATISGNGDVVACGTAVQPVDFGGGLLAALGKSDGWVAAYAGSSGAHHWSRRLGGTGDDTAYAVAGAADGSVAVAGGFDALASFGGTSLTPAGSADAYVAKYTSTGTPVWVTQLGGVGDDLARSVAITGGVPIATGYFYGTGTFNGISLTSAGAADAFVVTLP